MVDNSIALGVKPPSFDISAPLVRAAQMREMQVQAQAAEVKMRQEALGAEARGLMQFANHPEFAQRWAQSVDKLAAQGVLDPQTAENYRRTPSPLLLKQIIASTESPSIAFQREEAQRSQANADRSFGLQQQQFALNERAANRRDEPEQVRILRATGVDPASAEGKKLLFPKTDTPISATDKKAIFSAEDDVPRLEATIQNIQRAKELNPSVYSGVGASIRGTMGAKLPDMLVPDAIASPERGAATSEWDQLMGAEAIKLMGETLKGASTDFEMRKFLGIAADTSQPPKVRENAMNRFVDLANKELDLRKKRASGLRSGDYFKPDGGQGVAAPEGAIKMLKADPSLREQFDAKYGAGSAAKVLGK